MISNYIKIAWRNLIRNKFYSIINIGGLAIGMTVSFMLLLYVYNEFSFDKFNVNSDRLYKVFCNRDVNGDVSTGGVTPAPLAPSLKKDFPEIEQAARTNYPFGFLINYKDKSIKVNTMAADESLLDMFSFDFIYGNNKQALSQLSTVVLTQSAAKAIFGNVNPIGKVVQFENKHPLTVSAVIKDNPQNSSFSFNALISWKTLEKQEGWVRESNWGNFSFSTYVLLKPGTSVTAANQKIKNILAQNGAENKNAWVFLYPFTRVHLYSDFKNGVNVGGSIEHVRLFLFLAIGILLIACINFMNLSTARSERRAREVGVRKVIGAHRFGLIQQFISESVLMALLAFMLSLLLMVLLLPVFNTIIGIHLELPYTNTWAWVAAIAVTLFTGLIAGSYPALFLSSFNPVRVLKGQLSIGKSSVRPRHVLVVIQFTFTTCLILSSIFIYKQIGYIKDRPVGYNLKGVIEMPAEGSLYTQFKGFRQDAINAGAITDGAITSQSIVHNGNSSWNIKWPGQLAGEEKTPIDQLVVTFMR